MKLAKFINNIIREHLNEQQSSNEKLIAYHGTPHGKFDKFSMKKRGKGADVTGVGDYGKGFYFTPNKEIAVSHATETFRKRGDIVTNAPTLYTVELTMNNPFDMRLLTRIKKMSIDLAKKYGVLNIPDIEYKKMYSELGITEDEHDFYSEVEDMLGDNWGDWDIQSKLKTRGFDSLISFDGSEYVVYSPNQIKIVNVEDVA